MTEPALAPGCWLRNGAAMQGCPNDARSRSWSVACLGLAIAACSSPSPTHPLPTAAESPSVAAPAPPVPAQAAAAPASPSIEPVSILFPDPSTIPRTCAALAASSERTRCFFAARYGDDPEALRIALDWYDKTGNVAGVDVAHDMDGGFRGVLHLVPEPPVGKHRRHLGWVVAASADFDDFFARLAPLAAKPIRYRHRPLAYRFFRSVGRTTPSAYADGWAVAYNVSGSLHGSADAVRETLFHEIFHLNDTDHHDWSVRVLGEIFDAIVQRCGTRVACLEPYAPGDTMVRGGTYYAFQPQNGEAVREYAAELGLRYYREQRAALSAKGLGRTPFKCGPDENRRAWEAVGQEFFGGVDAVPACPR